MAKKAAKKKKASPVSRGRRADGAFAVGNTIAPGGAREGAGRKPLLTHEVISEISLMTTTRLDKDGKPIGDELHGSVRAMQVLLAELESPFPSKDRLTAARIIMDRQLGKARETLEVKMGNNAELDEVIAAATVTAEIQRINGGTKAKT